MTLIILGIIFMLVQIAPLLKELFHFLKAVLMPYLLAVIISYVLHPVVNLFSGRAVPRSVAVLLIYTLFIASIGIVFVNMSPLVNTQMKEMAEHLPEWNLQMQSWIQQYNDNKYLLPDSVRAGIEKSLDRLEQWVTDGIGNLLTGLGTTLNQVFLALIIPFLVYYMLKDAQVIERSFVTLFPRHRRKEILRVLRDIDEALGNYVRGQLLVCLAVGGLAYIGYVVIGLPYALLLAGMVALFNIIPYLGPFFGAIPAVLVAMTISGKMVISVIVVNLVVQMLEGNVISPQIVGRTLHMHPLLIIFALLVGGEVGGILGMILAVPFFAVGKVILEHVALHYIHRS
ncbi:MAG: AI-2E family transporter [Planifilum sp.]